MDAIQQQLDNALLSINDVLIGKPEQTKLALCCVLAGGHLLIEDLPGMGKTTLSHGLAKVLGLQYQRVQFTSDMLPADLLGVSIFDQHTKAFEFHRGPIFNQVLLADEINRANPKTQSALLEAMEEQQVSVDGQTYELPSPFFVIATQNPLHQSGTFPLPESQLDRFLMRIQLGFPPPEAERSLLQQGKISRIEHMTGDIISPQLLQKLQGLVNDVVLSDAALNYIMALLDCSRQQGDFPNPLSPRAGLALVSAAKAYAFLHQRDYVIADDIKATFEAVAEHRLRAGSVAGLDTHYSHKILQQVDPLGAVG